jgi:hypothetical protein
VERVRIQKGRLNNDAIQRRVMKAALMKPFEIRYGYDGAGLAVCRNFPLVGAIDAFVNIKARNYC